MQHSGITIQTSASLGDYEMTTMQSIPLYCTIFWSFIFGSSALKYSNRWTVQINGDTDDKANRLAQKHGFVNHGKVIDNYYSFEHQKLEKISSVPSAHLHEELLSEPNVNMVEQQIMKSYKLLSLESVNFYVNDRRWPDMWYINRDDGQPTYNVIDVWKRNITGAGVVVAVVDEGFDPEHPEIKDNYDARASLDVVDNDSFPLPENPSVPNYGHGDKCAGVIAAVANNSNCGVGLAYNAKLGGIRLFVSDEAIDVDEARALSHEADHIDIYSNSWGPSDKGYEVAGPGHLARLALRNGAEKGRRGLGSIYVFAAGNGGLFVKDSCAFNGYVNNIYTIAITGIKSDGSIPIVGENCAGIMAVTYTMDIFTDTSKVVTADTNKACTDRFGASSASAAMASGLIALMLSANEDLSWRDVQHIIVRTARPAPVKISDSDWNTNKAGLRVNDYVGFGLMDATKMVDAALNWRRVPPKANCTIPRHGVNSHIPSKQTLEETINLSNWSDFCGDKINFLEHVEVRVNLTYTLRGELLIKLISPQGTVSNLTHYRMSDASFGAKDLNWVLMTLHHWGENATGPWRLTLENSHPGHNNTGILFDWTLILHGTTLNPLKNCMALVPPPNAALSPSSCLSKSTYGQTCSFSCKTAGYVLEGTAARVCGIDGKWTGSNRTLCRDNTPPSFNNTCPRNMTLHVPKCLSNTIVAWIEPVATDNSGHVIIGYPVVRPPANLSIGLYNVLYSATDSEGNKANCSFVVQVAKKLCPVLQPPVFGAITSLSCGSAYGSQAFFSCNEGHRLRGSRVRSCEADGRWSGNTTTCDTGKCPAIKAPANGEIVPDLCKLPSGVNYGTDCFLSCDISNGYQLEGPRHASCLRNGSWNADISKVFCKDNTPPSFNNTCPRNMIFHVPKCLSNTIVSWIEPVATDNSGHVIISYPVVRPPVNLSIGLYNALYSATDSEGNGANCSFVVQVTKKLCPVLQPPVFGAITSLSCGSAYGSRAFFSCNEGHWLRGSRVRSCEADGRWSGNTTTCENTNFDSSPAGPAGKCPAIKAPANGEIVPDVCKLPSGVNYGTHCLFSCDISRGYQLEGPRHTSCLGNGSWNADISKVICKDQPKTGSGKHGGFSILQVILPIIGTFIVIVCAAGIIVHLRIRNFRGKKNRVDSGCSAVGFSNVAYCDTTSVALNLQELKMSSSD